MRLSKLLKNFCIFYEFINKKIVRIIVRLKIKKLLLCEYEQNSI